MPSSWACPGASLAVRVSVVAGNLLRGRVLAVFVLVVNDVDAEQAHRPPRTARWAACGWECHRRMFRSSSTTAIAGSGSDRLVQAAAQRLDREPSRVVPPGTRIIVWC